MYIPGTSFSETLSGTNDADTIEAFGGDDVIFDGNGNDTVLGGRGDDYLAATGLGDDDIFNGGSGIDMVEYGNLLGPVTINLATQTVTGATTGNDLLVSIEYASGSQGNDQITGNRLDNILVGRAGNDAIYGGFGRDQLVGHMGDDSLFGGAGRDLARYDYDHDRNGGIQGIVADLKLNIVQDTTGGTDTLRSIEDIDGSIFDDILLGRGGTNDASQNDLRGNAGNDTLDGRGGIDILSGGAGADTFVFSTLQGFDYLRDFEHGVDQIQLSARTFKAFGASFTRDEFNPGATSDASSAIYYDRSTGILAYEFNFADPDGTGGIIARLNPGTILTFSDFTFV